MIMNLFRHIDRTKVVFDFVENNDETADYDDEIQALGGRIYRCPHYNGKNHFEYIRWWNHFFEEHKDEYHIIHGHLGSTAAFYLKIAKRYGLFTIAHSHNTNDYVSIKNVIFKTISYPTRYIADWFFSCSQAAGVKRFGQKIVHGNRYMVLNNAIETNDFRYDQSIRDEERGTFLLGDSLVVGHVGRFVNQKNHHYLIQIFKKIVENNYNSILLLVGFGRLQKDIEDLVYKEGLTNKVIFTGVRSDVNRIMQAMDVFVLPSLYEGLPVTLVEAQTSGLPCIISDRVPPDCSIIPELISTCKLEESPEKWAELIIEKSRVERKDRKKEIEQAGFDVANTAKWLEGFYIEHSR